MTVRKLRMILDSMPKEWEDFDVVMSKDSEGNDFSPLASYGTARYIPITSYRGELAEESGPLTNAIVLWPTN